MGPHRFTGQAPLQEHEPFSKEHCVHVFEKHSCTDIFPLKNIHVNAMGKCDGIL